MNNTCTANAMYVHVPFCKTICSYCDFVHQMYRSEVVEKWLDALAKELQARFINPNLTTVYIGGGTPSSLSEKQLERFLKLLSPYTQHVLEYTIEVNPETISEEKVDLFVKYGINRISMGYQAYQQDMLELMNRHHTYQDVVACMDLFRKKGITNISLDLMYSLPNTTLDDLKESLDYALCLKPTHLSLYSLMIEENTVFGKKQIEPCEEDVEADMYEYLCDRLEREGFHRYEISNFATSKEYESKHNKVYWHYEDFYGVSCGASGKEGMVRYDNTPSLKTYLENPLERNEIPLTKKDAMFEMVMMNLRLQEGLSLSSFKKRFDESFLDVYHEKLEPLLASNQLLLENDFVHCTKESLEILNEILVGFLD